MTSLELARIAADGIAKKILTAWLELRLIMHHGDNGQATEARRLYHTPPRVDEANISKELGLAFHAERGTRLYRIVAEEPELQRMLSNGELWEVPPEHIRVVSDRIQRLPQELEQALVEALGAGA